MSSSLREFDQNIYKFVSKLKDGSVLINPQKALYKDIAESKSIGNIEKVFNDKLKS